MRQRPAALVFTSSGMTARLLEHWYDMGLAPKALNLK